MYARYKFSHYYYYGVQQLRRVLKLLLLWSSVVHLNVYVQSYQIKTCKSVLHRRHYQNGVVHVLLLISGPTVYA